MKTTRESLKVLGQLILGYVLVMAALFLLAHALDPDVRRDWNAQTKEVRLP